MLIKRTNLQQKLENHRNRELSGEDILEQVKFLLSKDYNRGDQIQERLQNGKFSGSNDLKFDLLESIRIFHISHIQKIAISYRLRFLDSIYFKGPIPQKTISKIKELEIRHQTTIKGFKILAPSKNLKLENADDPLLFAPIGNDYYLLIDKWGKDLHPLRKLLMWPLRDFENLLLFSLVISFLGALGFRELFFAEYRSTTEFLMLYLFSFKSIVGLILFYGIALGKNFNSSIWRSKYYNA